MPNPEVFTKFYKTEKERLEKLRTNASHIHEFWTSMKDHIKMLEKLKIRFSILHMDFSGPPTLHCIIYRCCGNTDVIPEETIKNLEKDILEKSKFQIIKWE